MKKRIVLLMTLVMVLAAATALAGIPKKPSQFSYVIDETNTLSQADKDTINEYGEALLQATGGKTNGDEVVALIVEFLDGMDSNEYATKVINEWGLGDNSMLILLATGDRAVEIGAGKGLDRLVSASARGELIDKNLDYFANDRFAEGMVALYMDVAKRDASVRGKTLSVQAAAGTAQSASVSEKGDEGGSDGMGIFIAVFLIIVVIAVLSLRRNGRRRTRGTPPPPRGGLFNQPQPGRPQTRPMQPMAPPQRGSQGGLFNEPYGSSRPAAPRPPQQPYGGSRPAAPRPPQQPYSSSPMSSRPSAPGSSGSSGRNFGGIGSLFGGSSSGRSSGSGRSFGSGRSTHSSSGSFGRSGGSRGSGAGRKF